MKNKNLGFTLIELLVVIAIVGFLASSAVYALNSARINTRDTKRVADLSVIRKALFSYANDHGELPKEGFGSGGGGQGWATRRDSDGDCYNDGCLEDVLEGTDSDSSYISSMPRDPKCGGYNGCGGSPGGYMYYHKGSCATLMAHLENPSAEELATCDNEILEDAYKSCYYSTTFTTAYGMNYCLDVIP